MVIWDQTVQQVLHLQEIPQLVKKNFFGEFLINAQGEDVVAGTRTPQYITKAAKIEANAKEQSMEEAMPKVFKQLTEVFIKLEKHYRDMQDIEFTVENNKNYGCSKQDQVKELQEQLLKLLWTWSKKN